MNKYLLTIVGPTAIGKTSLSIALAKHYNTEIISSDSRQFYKEMNIGTAVPSKEELNAVKHHFIQHISIHQNYSVGDFEKEALAKLNLLFKTNNIVVMVGGSGLYTNAVIDGLDYFPEVNPEIRVALNEKIADGKIKELQQQLKVLDETSYHTIAIENPHRLVRALEICIGTGKSYSSFKNKVKENRNFIPIKIGLEADREIIYQRINQRVETMVETGLLEEAQKLWEFKDVNALQTVGYRELFSYFEGNLTKAEAISEIKKNTRRFAKRQLTWNRKDTDIYWFNYQTPIANVIGKLNTLMNFEEN